MVFYAHSLKGSPENHWQLLVEHLNNVADLAADMAEPFNAADWARAAGLLHDLGKYSLAFQERLRGGARVDHSTAGAKEAMARLGEQYGKLLAYLIAGHHGGLPDGVSDNRRSLEERFRKRPPELAETPPDPLKGIALSLPAQNKNSKPGAQLSFFLRMVFSCLVDADFLDTEAFMDPQKARWREGRPGISDLWPRLEKYLDKLRAKADLAPLNQRRNQILEACLKAAPEKPGFYSLTVPTGGGKTISSLAFGLGHAMKNDLRRVVYVIPYTSIIEQNARVFKNILGDESVLEHHSNLPAPAPGEDSENPSWRRNRLAAENWDAPVIVTTNVQFFESLFANRPARCRKLHNIAGGVIILDEAQMLPRESLIPCLEALKELVVNYGCTVLLCTATQPALNDADTFKKAAIQPREIAPDPPALYRDFRRVEIVKHDGELSNSDLAARLAGESQVLCVVNTRTQARQVFQELRNSAGSSGCYHLSALMYPGHRAAKLAEIREALASPGRVCRVVSTQLVEAGVDLDFPVVWRALAGIDSLAQAAGRCNREGLNAGLGKLHVFEPDGGITHNSLLAPAQEARSILRSHDDPLSLDAVRAYFENLFWQQKHLLDEKGLMKLMEEGVSELNFPFATISQLFSYFDSPGEAVFVCPDNEKREAIIQGLRHSSTPGRFARLAQPYTVQLYPEELQKLEQSREVERIGEGLFPVLLNLDLYDDDLGLVLDLSGQAQTESLYI